MPRLNKTGQYTKGYGVCWFDEDLTIRQDCSSGICKIVLSDGTIIHEDGCNYVFAKNKVWIASLNSFGINEVFGSRDIELESASISSGPSPVASDLVSPDGAIAIKDKYNSFGPWHVHEADGSEWLLTNSDAHSIQLLGNKKAIWLEGNKLFRTLNLELDVPNRLMWWPRVALINGKYLLLYQDFETG